jgi:cytochrome c biogenesis protein
MQVKSFLKNLIEISASLTVTIAILILLIITFIVCALAGDIFLASGNGIFYTVLTFFGLSDIFRSWWFITLLSLFSINLLTCSLRRLPGTLKILRSSKEISYENSTNGKTLRQEWRWSNFKPQSATSLISILHNHFKKPFVTNDSQGLKLFAEKGKYSHFGFYLSHLGIPLIIIGGIFNAFGYQGSLKIKEGEVLDTFTIKKQTDLISKKLDFSIRCDDFRKIYYEDSDKAKGYQSAITLLKGGEEIKTATIDFSHSLKYQGVYIYQTLVGHVSDEKSPKKISLYVTHKNDLKKSKLYHAKVGGSFELAETGHTITVNEFISNYAVEDKDGSNSMVPAVELTVLDGEKKLYQGWVSANNLFDKKSKDYYFLLLSQPRNDANYTYTRLKISRKPGEQLIWGGCIAMIIGFGISFFIPHRRIWLQVEERGGIHYVTLVGVTTKNQQSFEKDFSSLCKEIRKRHQLFEVEAATDQVTTLPREAYGQEHYSTL